MSDPLDLNNLNFGKLNIDTEALETLRSSLLSQNKLIPEIRMDKGTERAFNELAIKRKEKEEREIRNLEINEERLQYDKMKLFLLSSVNKDQKFILEKIESLIDTIEFGNKVEEANLAIIQQELSILKQSADNLNESFIKFIEKKMMEMGVEAAIKYLLIGIKELFLNA